MNHLKTELERYQELLIVVDMVNGFVKKGKMADPTIQKIIPAILKELEEFKQNREGVAFIKDSHTKDSLEWNRFPKHCEKGTAEVVVVEELHPFEQDALSYEKDSTSTFFAPNFKKDIDRMKKLRKIIVTGCCTDICILNLVLPLRNYFDQERRDIELIVPMDAVETFDSPNHLRESYNEMAFRLMDQAGVTLLKKRGN